MKTICLVTRNLSIAGGAQRVTSLLANALCEKYRVIVISSLCQSDTEIAYTFLDKVQVIVASKGTTSQYKAIWQSAKNVRQILKREKVEAIFSVGAGVYPTVFSYGIFSKRKMILCEHSNLANKIDNNRAQSMYEFIGAKTASEIVTLTEQDCANYKNKFHIGNVRHIYNWIDLENMNASESYHADTKRILSVVRMTKVKGIDLLIKVAAQVLTKHRDWEWHLYGDGPLFEAMKACADAQGVLGQLKFMGRTDNIYEIYPQYSLYVMTSYYEGLPMVLLEAKANNLPIVSFNCQTGPSEIVTDGMDGYLVPPYDVDLMAEKINCLIVHREQRLLFSKNAKNNISKFDKKEILNQWCQLIEEVTNN